MAASYLGWTDTQLWGLSVQLRRLIASFSRDDFVRARRLIAGLERYRDHEDWLDAHEGICVGYGMAGAEVTVIPVHVSAFAKWCADHSLPANLSTLKLFVASADAGRVATIH